MEVWRLLEEGQYEEAQARLDHVNEAIGPVRAKIGAVSGGYRFGKGLAAAMGQPAGPPRPPGPKEAITYPRIYPAPDPPSPSPAPRP